MACARSMIMVAALGLGCADDGGPAATTAATIGPATSGATAADSTGDATSGSPTSDADDDAPADASTTGTPPDVPDECMPGDIDCPCDGDECVHEGLCITGVCELPSECDEDPNEPNDVSAEATMLAGIDDDDASGATVSGVLADPFDMDWFTYPGTDVTGQTVDPARMAVVSGGTLEMCKYLDCVEGTELVVCPPGTVAEESAGYPGCCGTGPIAFDADGFECEAGAFETSAQVYIRLRNADAQCVEYTVSYHY
ncbi:MAG TPA: hypothetical protein VFG69_08145 [Nannocystaceae bacterium]|nr:hypothetical protein [Nannocystaceae bacterium]